MIRVNPIDTFTVRSAETECIARQITCQLERLGILETPGTD